MLTHSVDDASIAIAIGPPKLRKLRTDLPSHCRLKVLSGNSKSTPSTPWLLSCISCHETNKII